VGIEASACARKLRLRLCICLLFTRHAVTFPAKEHHRPLTGTKLYCLVTGIPRTGCDLIKTFKIMKGHYDVHCDS